MGAGTKSCCSVYQTLFSRLHTKEKSGIAARDYVHTQYYILNITFLLTINDNSYIQFFQLFSTL